LSFLLRAEIDLDSPCQFLHIKF